MPASSPTGFVTHPSSLLHDMGAGHPESPARLAALQAHLAASGLLAELETLTPRPASAAELARAHDPEHVEDLRLAAIGALSNLAPKGSHELLEKLVKSGEKPFAEAAEAALDERDLFAGPLPDEVDEEMFDDDYDDDVDEDYDDLEDDDDRADD